MKQLFGIVLLLIAIICAFAQYPTDSTTNWATFWVRSNAYPMLANPSNYISSVVAWTISTNDIALGSWQTNTAQRARVSEHFTMTSAIATAAKVTLYVDQDATGDFEQAFPIQVGAGSVVANIMWVGTTLQPLARFVFSNECGVGSSAVVVGNSVQRVKE